jgi:hypothetical protein
LIVILVARLAGSLDLAVRGALTRARSRVGSERSILEWALAAASERALVSLAIFVVVAIQAPVSAVSILDGLPAHYVVTVDAPAPKPYVQGGPSLGYASPGALPPGMVTNLERIFTAEAGPHGSVFDLSDAPGIVDFLLKRNPASRFYDISLAITPAAQRLVIADIAKSKPRVILFSGVSGLSTWDFIANEVRQYLVSEYVLSHYIPLVSTSGELVLIANDVTPAPLPKLIGHPAIHQLYFSQGACALGYIPDFLTSPAPPPHALTLPLEPIPSKGKGRLYQVTLPADRHGFEWLALNRTGVRAAAITIGNIVRPSGADVPWHDITWVATSPTTVASVGSCLPWHGFGPTLFLRYDGPGNPTSVRLFNA